MSIKDLRNTTEISNIAHKEQEPVFIAKNGYSDLIKPNCNDFGEEAMRSWWKESD